MNEGYIYKRLADKSAFVVFEKASYRTYVIQKSFMYDFLTQKNVIESVDYFECLNFTEQKELLEKSGIEEELA